MQKIYPLLLLFFAVVLSSCGGSEPDGSGGERPPLPVIPNTSGEWLWLAEKENGTKYSGFLSVTAALEGGDDVRDARGGAWRVCEDGNVDSCPGVDGAGFISNVYADGAWNLTTSFSDMSRVLKLVALDNNNRIGTEIEGEPTFLGSGLWYETPRSGDVVSVGMVKIADVGSAVSEASLSAVQDVTEALNAQSLSSAKASSEADFVESLKTLFTAVSAR